MMSSIGGKYNPILATHTNGKTFAMIKYDAFCATLNVFKQP